MTTWVPFSSEHNNRLVITSSGPVGGTDTHLYSEELLAEEVLRLRVFLLGRTRLRHATSPPSQVEQQYGTVSTLTSSPPSIFDSQTASRLEWSQPSVDKVGVKYYNAYNCYQLCNTDVRPWANVLMWQKSGSGPNLDKRLLNGWIIKRLKNKIE